MSVKDIDTLHDEIGQLKSALLREQDKNKKFSSYSKKDLLSQNKQLRDQLDNYIDRGKVISDIISSSLKELPSAPFICKADLHRSKFDPEDVGLLFSDAQVGTGFKSRDVSGLGPYNFKVFCDRLNRMTESVLSIRERHSKAYNLQCLHIFMLGDIVEGEDIFTGQGFYLDLTAFEQIIKGCRAITESIWKLAHVFPRIRVYCVPGNHGRPQQKKGKNAYLSNWDTILYEFLKRDLSKSKAIEVFNSNSAVLAAKIQNHIFVASHGDEVKSYMSVPFYGLERLVYKRISLFNNLDYYLCAHHHRMANFDVNFSEALMNGSFPGWSDLSVNKMSSASLPSQTLFGIHPRKGITFRYKLRLEEKPKYKLDSH